MQDCIGVSMGPTYHAWCMVVGEDPAPYCNQHDTLIQNALATCTFGHKLIYILVGSKGSTNDARVLIFAIRRQ